MQFYRRTRPTSGASSALALRYLGALRRRERSGTPPIDTSHQIMPNDTAKSAWAELDMPSAEQAWATASAASHPAYAAAVVSQICQPVHPREWMNTSVLEHLPVLVACPAPQAHEPAARSAPSTTRAVVALANWRVHGHAAGARTQWTLQSSLRELITRASEAARNSVTPTAWRSACHTTYTPKPRKPRAIAMLEPGIHSATLLWLCAPATPGQPPVPGHRVAWAAAWAAAAQAIAQAATQLDIALTPQSWKYLPLLSPSLSAEFLHGATSWREALASALVNALNQAGSGVFRKTRSTLPPPWLDAALAQLAAHKGARDLSASPAANSTASASGAETDAAPALDMPASEARDRLATLCQHQHCPAGPLQTWLTLTDAAASLAAHGVLLARVFVPGCFRILEVAWHRIQVVTQAVCEETVRCAPDSPHSLCAIPAFAARLCSPAMLAVAALLRVEPVVVSWRVQFCRDRQAMSPPSGAATPKASMAEVVQGIVETLDEWAAQWQTHIVAAVGEPVPFPLPLAALRDALLLLGELIAPSVDGAAECTGEAPLSQAAAEQLFLGMPRPAQDGQDPAEHIAAAEHRAVWTQPLLPFVSE